LYAVQRMTQLATLFTLLALLAYIEARQVTVFNTRHVLYGWILFPLFLFSAVLSKEIGVLIILYVVLFELSVFQTSLNTLRRNKQLALWLLVFVFVPLSLGLTYFLTHVSQVTDYSNRTFTLGERLLTQVHVLFFYMKMIILPNV